MPLYTLNFSVTRTCKPLSRNVENLSLVISSLKVTFVLLQTSVLVLWSIFDFLTIFIRTREEYVKCEFISHSEFMHHLIFPVLYTVYLVFN